MLALYHTISLILHKGIVASRYIQRELGTALSTIALIAISLLKKHGELLGTCARKLPNILDPISQA